MAKITRYTQGHAKPLKTEEAQAAYPAGKKTVAVADFPYRKLKKLADTVPFTQSEWAQMLHLSERTLQRYAKNNISFEGIYTDRIILLQEMIGLGLATFTDAQAFYQWLKKNKTVMGQALNFSSLASDRGIQLAIDQLNRIQQGVYA